MKNNEKINYKKLTIYLYYSNNKNNFYKIVLMIK